jgi:hypothetical protein
VAFTEFYCQTTGSNLNAGSTTADVAAYTATNGNWSSTTGVFTPTSGNPSLSVAVGDFCSVYPDAATVGVFVARVTAVSSTTITLSTTAKAGTAPTTGATGISLKAGGAWKGPNGASGFPFGFVASTLTNAAGSLPRVNLKGGTNYAITAAMTHANPGVTFQGYTSSPGDGGRATVDGGTSGASYTLLTLSGAAQGCVLADMLLQNNGVTGSVTALSVQGTNSVVFRCVVSNVRGSGFLTGNNGVVLAECEGYGCNQSNGSGLGGFWLNGNGLAIRCVSHDNAGTNSSGYVVSGHNQLVRCIADTNGSHGLNLSNAVMVAMTQCEAYNNSSDGVRIGNAGNPGFYIESCNFVKNGGYGVNGSGAGTFVGFLLNCGFGSGTQANTSGATVTLKGIVESGSITYAPDVTPWVDPANGDFRINLAAAKGTGRGAFTQTQAGYAGTVAYPDIGAAQPQEVTGGGGSGGGVLISSVGSQLIKVGW